MPPLLLGIFVRALQMTVIGPSLLGISRSLGATLADVGWIMAIYATGSLLAQPVAGRMSDALGRRMVFAGALVVFTAGSVACALSTSLAALIAGRVVQSLGAGAIQPAVVALVGQRVPKERQSGALYAIYGMFALAGALGSVLGGALIDGGHALSTVTFLAAPLRAELAAFPWHLVFWINVPIAAAALVLAMRLEPDAPQRERMGLDAGAIVLIPCVALSLMLAANGTTSRAPLWLAIALAGLLALALWESRARAAFFEPALFRERGPLLLYAIAALTGVPIFSVTMYSAAFYMAAFHASAAQAGIALLALALPLGAGQGAGSRLARRWGSRALLVAGLVALAAGDLALAAATSRAEVLGAFALVGFGMGLASAPPNALILDYTDQRRSGAAAGLLTMLSSTGAITAPAVVSAMLNHSGLDAVHGFRAEFALSCAIALAALPAALALPLPRST